MPFSGTFIFYLTKCWDVGLGSINYGNCSAVVSGGVVIMLCCHAVFCIHTVMMACCYFVILLYNRTVDCDIKCHGYNYYCCCYLRRWCNVSTLVFIVLTFLLFCCNGHYTKCYCAFYFAILLQLLLDFIVPYILLFLLQHSYVRHGMVDLGSLVSDCKIQMKVQVRRGTLKLVFVTDSPPVSLLLGRFHN